MHYVSVGCESVCVLYYVAKGIYMYMYLHVAVSVIVLSLHLKHRTKTRNFSFRYKYVEETYLLKKQTFQFSNKASKFVVKLH